MTRPVIVLGAGGHAKVLIDALQACSTPIRGILDNDPAKQGGVILGIPVLGTDAKLKEWAPNEVVLVNGLGSTESLLPRAALHERLRAQGHAFLSVIHPSAVVSPHARLGEGVQIMAGAVVQAGTRLGDGCIVNTGALVDHDCALGGYVHVAPGAVLSGGVTVGSNTHIGTGAAVIQGIRVGSRCLVAAGAVVVHDVPDGSRVAGIPARKIKT
jgi:UDP-perosamine 4-acetyltransferase